MIGKILDKLGSFYTEQYLLLLYNCGYLFKKMWTTKVLLGCFFIIIKLCFLWCSG